MANARILVVDDQAGIRFILRKMLEDAGYAVIEANSGEDGLKVLKDEKVDLVIMDIMMPGMDGWEATKWIKLNPGTENVPVAILTVKSLDEDKLKSFKEAFADAHIEKPIIIDKTLGTIKWLLDNFPKRL